MPRKFYKHKILLDEGFHLRSRLQILNSRYDVKHIASDYKQTSLPDPQVYDLARKKCRLLVTYNVKDFAELAEKSIDTGIIGISPNMSLEHIDTKLTALLTKIKPKDLYGKLTLLTEE